VTRPDDAWTLDEIKEYLEERKFDPEGVRCPCCDRQVKVYRRRFNAGMGRIVEWLYTAPGSPGWTNVARHAPRHVLRSKEVSRLVSWELVEGHDTEVGLYRLTDRGRRFVEGRVRVLSHGLFDRGHFLGFAGRRVSLRDVLEGGRFRRGELREGARRGR